MTKGSIKPVLLSLGGLLTVLVLFLFSFQVADAQMSYDPFRPISNNPIFKMVVSYLEKNSTLNATLTTTLFGTHVTCGGGDQTKLNLGPVIENVTSCNECEQLAACAGQKKGASNVGYLWDAHTNVCGLGIVVTEAEAKSCEDTCQGVDPAKFALVKADAETATFNANTFWNTFPLTTELLLAATYYMSGWDPLFGTGSHPTDMCPSSQVAFEGNTLCGNPKLEQIIQDKFGKTCVEMPVSAKPEGDCGGRMGLAQIFPIDWHIWYSSIALANGDLSGTDQFNPWDQRDSFGAAAALLSIFLDESEGDEKCAIAKYVLGSGTSCANLGF